jgi:malate synthase
MNEAVERNGLKVEARLAAFIENDVLAPLGQEPGKFWSGFTALCDRLVPRNRELLAKRDSLQAQIDAWHTERRGKPLDAAA